MYTKHKVFICYHHDLDQEYKELLLTFNAENDIFIDASVGTDDIDDSLSDQEIRAKIRDNYLTDSSVTIVLVGLETAKRKHVDWEIYSSMYDGTVNKKSGVLVINLPTVNCSNPNAAHGELEKSTLYPDTKSWISIDRAEYERRYPYMPARIIDNLINPKAKISVVDWGKLTVTTLRLLIDLTYQDRNTCEYDLSRPMRRANS